MRVDLATDRPVEVERLLRYAVAFASIGAGLVHLAVAGDHLEHALIATFFIAAGCAQLVWAAAVAVSRSTRVLAAGAAGNGLLLGIWAASRLWGFAGIDGAETRQAVGVNDAMCVILEVLIVAGIGLWAVLPTVARAATLRPDAAVRALAATGAVVLAFAVPGVVVPHEHEHSHGSDSHLAGEILAEQEHLHERAAAAVGGVAHARADHAHADDVIVDAEALTVHEHESGTVKKQTNVAHTHTARASHATHGANVPEVGHVHGASAACKPTSAQRAAADKLRRDTARGLEKYRDVRQAHADGYFPYPPFPANWTQHYINYERIKDSDVLNPDKPESLLYAMTDDGYRPISALYIMPKIGMNGPAVGGCLTHWHHHTEIVAREPWEPESPQMLHVFVVPMKGGAFAHDADAQAVRELYTPFRVLVSPWYKDSCYGTPALPGEPWRVLPGCT